MRLAFRTIATSGLSRAREEELEATPNTSAIRSNVGSVGNIRPRSIFDSSASDSPLCFPSSTARSSS
jgi:hypothetical protein